MRKFLCLFVMSLFVFALSGCGGGGGHGSFNKPEDTDKATYTSGTPSENALLITSSDTYDNIIVNKSGDATGENYDTIGDNAAVLAKNGAKPVITNAVITTDAKGANAVFSYGGSLGASSFTPSAIGDGTTITIKTSEITTTGDNSGGIMVTGGGIIDASDLEITTSGQSSAAVRSGQGGGKITVDGGDYKTSGQGSPAVYSAADISVSAADLVTESSQGVIIEGGNSVTLNSVNISADHKAINSDETTHQAVLIYQSDSGAAADGKASFTMTGGSITNATGDIFCVTNTSCDINLNDVSITNNDTSGNFMTVAAQKWGTNGGNVTLNAVNQSITGNIIVDDSSSLVVNLTESSDFSGMINNAGSSAVIDINIVSDSVWTLTGNSKITSLTGGGTINYGVYSLNLDGYSFNESIPYDPTGTVSRDIETNAATGGSHAIAVDTGTSYYEDITVTKTGDASDSATNYNNGSNSAILASGDASIFINGSETTITTTATYGTAAFANGGSINIIDAKITTNSDNSDGLTAANGGRITASNVNIVTKSLSSAAMRTINGGTITASSSTMNANNAQGLVMDGGNSVTLNSVTLTGSQAVFISGDATEGTANLTIDGGTVTNKADEIIRVSNSKCNINLSRVSFVNNTQDFLKTETDSSVITIEANNQQITGNITTGSTLNLNLRSGSSFNGAINTTGTKGNVSVILDTGATWTLNADSYVTNMSISGGTLIRNGCTLYENGKEYTN